MRRDEQLRKWRRDLKATFPIVGASRRKNAIAALVANRNQADAITLMIEARTSFDAEVAAQANGALLNLSSAAAVDALCATWARTRDEGLASIMVQRGYVASGPPELQVLSGLKAEAVAMLGQADAAAVAEVVKALTDADPVIARNAERVLNSLVATAGIDALCALWATTRDERLGAIVAQCEYVASKPLEVRVLSALKSGKRISIDRADIVPFVINLLSDGDPVLSANAANALAKTSPGPAQDVLWNHAIRSPQAAVAQLLIRAGKRPADPEVLSLFLFVTGQLDLYFKEDYEFQNLRLAYNRADAQIQANVMAVIRSGDRRCAGFLGTRSKPLVECSDEEIRLALDSWVRHQEWSRLFLASLELPLRYSLPHLQQLRNTGWEPEAADLRSVFRQVVSDADGQVPLPIKEPSVASSLFEQLLVEGRTGDLSRQSEAALCAQLSAASPLQGVNIVGALASKGKLTDGTVQAVQASPHWLVRLAGHAAGIYPTNLARDAVADTNYWITELAVAKDILDFWPAKATPADLKQITALPPEAFAGRLGASRRILNTILQYRNVMVGVDDFIVSANEYEVIVDDV